MFYNDKDLISIINENKVVEYKDKNSSIGVFHKVNKKKSEEKWDSLIVLDTDYESYAIMYSCKT